MASATRKPSNLGFRGWVKTAPASGSNCAPPASSARRRASVRARRRRPRPGATGVRVRTSRSPTSRQPPDISIRPRRCAPGVSASRPRPAKHTISPSCRGRTRLRGVNPAAVDVRDTSLSMTRMDLATNLRAVLRWHLPMTVSSAPLVVAIVQLAIFVEGSRGSASGPARPGAGGRSRSAGRAVPGLLLGLGAVGHVQGIPAGTHQATHRRHPAHAGEGEGRAGYWLATGSRARVGSRCRRSIW
jgi:hypothetical protein